MKHSWSRKKLLRLYLHPPVNVVNFNNATFDSSAFARLNGDTGECRKHLQTKGWRRSVWIYASNRCCGWNSAVRIALKHNQTFGFDSYKNRCDEVLSELRRAELRDFLHTISDTKLPPVKLVQGMIDCYWDQGISELDSVVIFAKGDTKYQVQVDKTILGRIALKLKRYNSGTSLAKNDTKIEIFGVYEF